MKETILVTGGAGFIGSHVGLQELTQWLSTQDAKDHVAAARRELQQRGLTS